MNSKLQDINTKVNNDINSKVHKIVEDLDRNLDEIVLKKQVMIDEKISKVDAKIKHCCSF